MKKSFYQKMNNDFFIGKKAKALVDITNNGGDTIKAGEIVTITGKHRGFTVQGENAYVRMVDRDDIELIDDETKF